LYLTLDGQAAALIVVKKQPFSPKFFFEDLIPRDQVLDRMLMYPEFSSFR
jgi:hypothetical protein